MTTTETRDGKSYNVWKFGKDKIFSIVAYALTCVSLTLTGLTIGRELGKQLGLDGWLGTTTAWGIALVFDALWVGSLAVAHRAINQRATRAVVVSLTFAGISTIVSTGVLYLLGHIGVWCAVPATAALFHCLAIFAEQALASPETEREIRASASASRNALAEARANAERLSTQALVALINDVADYKASAQAARNRTKILTKTQSEIVRAQAKAQKKLKKLEDKHGKNAKAYEARNLTPESLGFSVDESPELPEVVHAELTGSKAPRDSFAFGIDTPVETESEQTFPEIPIPSLMPSEDEDTFPVTRGALAAESPRPRGVSVIVPPADDEMTEKRKNMQSLALKYWALTRMNGKEPQRSTFAAEAGISNGWLSRILNHRFPMSYFEEEDFEEVRSKLVG